MQIVPLGLPAIVPLGLPVSQINKNQINFILFKLITSDLILFHFISNDFILFQIISFYFK